MADFETDTSGTRRLSAAHRAWRWLPRGPRREIVNAVTAALAPRVDEAPPPAEAGLAVAGELTRASGLGQGARLMLRAARSLGLPAYPLVVGDRAAALPPHGVPLVLHVNAPQMAGALLRLPRGLSRGRRVIGYWAWELPVVPQSWRTGLRFVHEIWAPSGFTARALEVLLPGRVRCVPHPVALDLPAPLAREPGMRRGFETFGVAPGVVVVVVSFSLASSFERKNPLGAIAAFVAAFGDRADRLLVLKVSHAGDFPADLARLRDAANGRRNIRLDTRLLQDADHLAMITDADIVLSLHRSEGFGLVPAEAMLRGVPVVATGWSGNLDYMDAASAALIGYRLIAARDPRGVFEAPGAVWAEPDIGHAAGELRRLADDAGARAALGAAGQARARAVLGAEALRGAMAALKAEAPRGACAALP